MIAVNIEDVWNMMKRRQRINHPPLEEIEWYQNGKKVEINKDVMEHFAFTGLNNIDFITTGYYKKKKAEERIKLPLDES
jgi:hypothetical protein